MATRLICDGCEAVILGDGATRVGLLDPVVYCPGCLARWQAIEAQIAAARHEAVETFEASRAALLTIAAERLKAVPDG
jgi:hypothetical protein